MRTTRTIPGPATAITHAAIYAVFIALAFAMPVRAQAPEVITSFASAQGNGSYAFASSTPKTLPELFGGKAPKDVNIVGHLFLPSGTDRAPAVVLVHGSGGVYPAYLDFWPKKLNAAGFAVFALDLFGPRGVSSTADDQTLVPSSADLADAFNALALLATHPRVDPKRIAVMGFSRGGAVAWRSSLERVIRSQKLPDGLRFAAHVPVYTGGCTGSQRVVVKPGVFAKEPMLFIHGDADDYTPIEPCKSFADEIRQAGTPVEFVVIPGAHHKFDADDLRRHYNRSVVRSKADCPIRVDIDTFAAYDSRSGARLQGDAYRDMVKECAAQGANTEGNHRARDKAADAAVAFLKQTLAR